MDSMLKAAIVSKVESIGYVSKRDAMVFCLGVREDVDGGDFRAAYRSNSGAIRDPDDHFIRLLQRQTIQGNPIFWGVSRCGGGTGSVEEGRARIIVEHARLIDGRRGWVYLGVHWGPQGRLGYLSTLALEKDEHGWRVVGES